MLHQLCDLSEADKYFIQSVSSERQCLSKDNCLEVPREELYYVDYIELVLTVIYNYVQ